jgi:hypothetical protein
MSSNNSQSAPSGGKQRVLVNVILDKSGSMSTKVQDVIGGFNLYLDELAKEPAVDYGFSLTLFDTVVEMKYKAAPLSKVAKLDDATYRPSGNTALFDAIAVYPAAERSPELEGLLRVITSKRPSSGLSIRVIWLDLDSQDLVGDAKQTFTRILQEISVGTR